jgi:predicted lipid carrier protein YhbT
VQVATIDEVWATVHDLVARLDALEPEVRTKYLIERTVSCRVYDLDVVFVGRLCEEGLLDVHTEPVDKAQVRLSCSSDDLIALAEGRLAAPTAFATGRLRVQAGPMDLLRLRQLI